MKFNTKLIGTICMGAMSLVAGVLSVAGAAELKREREQDEAFKEDSNEIIEGTFEEKVCDDEELDEETEPSEDDK